MKRLSERNAHAAGVGEIEIRRIMVDGTEKGYGELRSMGCSAENKAYDEIKAAVLTPFKVILGRDTILLHLESVSGHTAQKGPAS